ncbi:MAG TPA: hypothetical protein VGA08_04015, partial [Candidatus Saccharimonadales bacterium]
MANASVVDQTATNTGVDTPATTGTTPTTTNDNDLLIAGITVNAARSFSAWTNSFIEQSDHSNGGAQGTAELTVGSTGAYSTGATLSGTGAWIGQIAAFKGAAATGPIYPYITQGGYVFENDDGAQGSAEIELIKTDDAQCNETDGECTTTVNFTAATADNLLVAVCSGLGQSEVPTLSGTGYTSAIGPTPTSNTSVQEVYYKVSTGGETSVSCTSTITSGNVVAMLTFFEYSGIATSSVVDQTASSTGNSNNPATGTTPTTTNDTNLLIGAVTVEANTTFSTWSNSFTQLSEQAFSGGSGLAHAVADRLVTATGTYSTDAVAATGDQWVGHIVAFKSDGGGQEAADATKTAGSEFSSGKTLSAVRRGEHMNLRTHITNSGAALAEVDELALFYDRNDGRWSKVQSSTVPRTGAGSGCDDTDFDCSLIADFSTGLTLGTGSGLATGPHGEMAAVLLQDGTPDTVWVAVYVGSGGSNCGSGIADWSCEGVETGSGNIQHPTIGISPDGTIWLAFIDAASDDLVVANQVGDGTGNCSNNYWDCVSVRTSVTSAYPEIAFDTSGNPWISFFDDNNDDLVVAEYVSSGGSGCDSAAWECTAVDTLGTTNLPNYSIAFTPSNVAWISYYNNSDLYVAEYVSSGGSGCDSAAWECTAVLTADDVGTHSSISIAPDGNPWISYKDDTNDDL